MNAPASTGSLVQHRDVKLAAGEVDWTTFLSNTADSLSTLQSEAGTSSTELSTALGNVSDAFSTQISGALTGFDTGINNALFGGWYGSDDGYVFGLFGGEPVLGGPTSGITGSLLTVLSNDFANISTNPNGSEQLFSDLNNYELELLDHTLKPLLAPLLDETTKGVTTLSIPVELSQIQTNLLTAFGDYNELKGVSETVLSPEISGVFALTSDLDTISAAFTSGDSATAMTEQSRVRCAQRRCERFQPRPNRGRRNPVSRSDRRGQLPGRAVHHLDHAVHRCVRHAGGSGGERHRGRRGIVGSRFPHRAA
jgi:hypothetical protein